MRCPHCLASAASGQRFCDVCGGALQADESAAPPLQGERRQLTALFCDIVGSTLLAQRLDPEDLRDVFNAFVGRCRAVVKQFGGHFAGARGDGCMVLFGYPRSFEDAPVRAVRTGLALVEAIAELDHPSAPDLQVRIGVATGIAAVDAVAPGGEAVGEALNLAARLQEAAAPGAVVVSAATHALSGKVFEFEALAPLRLKGFAEPVAAWRVLGLSRISGRFEAFRAPALTPFVGRDAELAALVEAWRDVLRGEGRAVLLAGEAGVGKSRIIREMLRHAAVSDATVLRYDSSPYHVNSVLHPLIEAVERGSPLSPSQAAGERLDGLRQRLQRLGGPWADHLPWIASLLGIGAETPAVAPQLRKERTFAALLWWLAEVARRAPALLVVEDAHWIDPTSRELLDLVLARLDELGVLVVISCRPETAGEWAQDPRVAPIFLERLETREAARLVQRVAGQVDIAADLVNEIVARTDGVPLFIEELTKTALAAPDGAARRVLPVTLRDSLFARLDQLSEARRVAQIASVIGREFQIEVLAEVAGLPAPDVRASVTRLVESGLLVPQEAGSDEEYGFRHALLQEAAYESLWRQDRRELHARAARVLERTMDGRPGAAELLAHHFAEAAQPAAALKHLGIAARSAFERSANLEVIGHLSRALALLDALPPSPERDAHELRIQLLLGAAYWATKGFASKDVEASFTRAGDLAAASGDGGRLMDVLRGLFGCYYARGELLAARDQAERIGELARRTSERGDQMVARLVAGQILFWRGEFVAARAEQEGALALYDPVEQRSRTLSLQVDPCVNARIHLGWTLWSLGLPDQGAAAVERALADARRTEQPFSVAMALFWRAAVAHCCGDWEAVRRVTAELRRVTTEHHITYLGACATVLEGSVCIGAGELAAGVARLRQAFGEFRTQQAGLGWPWALSHAAAGCVQAGRRAEGLAFLEEAHAAMERNDERHWEAELLRLQSELLPDGPAAEAAAWRAVEIARRQSARSLELRAVVTLARRMGRRGAARDGRRLAASVLDGFTEGFGTTDVIAARRLVRELGSLPTS